MSCAMARRCVLLTLVGVALCLPLQPWPVIVGEDGFRSLLDGNDSGADNATADLQPHIAVADEEETAALRHKLAELARESEGPPQLERIKEDRIYTIKHQILGLLGFTSGAPTLNASDKEHMETVRDWYNEMRDMPEWPTSDEYTEKVQSFYPSCNLPRNTDEELWSNPNVMHLYFDVKYPEPLEGLATDIITAKLRLHKISKGTIPVADDNDRWSNMSSTELPETTVEAMNVTTTYQAPNEELIHISILYYTRSLKHNRVKKRILDSRMLPVYGDEWTEFDVGAAAKVWKQTGKNHGLVVHVENEYGEVVPAGEHFSPMDCTNEQQPPDPSPASWSLAEAWFNDTDSTAPPPPQMTIVTTKLPSTTTPYLSIRTSFQ